MSRADDLNRVLRKFQGDSPGVEASALISEDGLMIASVLPAGMEESRIAGMGATLLSLGARASVELKRGAVREVVVRGEMGYVVMIGAKRDVLLMAVTNETSKLGMIFFDMHEAIRELRRSFRAASAHSTFPFFRRRSPMSNIVLYDDGVHRNILLEDFDAGGFAVQANQHVIVHANSGMILDPGGHKVYSKVLSETFSVLGGGKLRYLFLSHQGSGHRRRYQRVAHDHRRRRLHLGAVDTLRSAFRRRRGGRPSAQADSGRGHDLRPRRRSA